MFGFLGAQSLRFKLLSGFGAVTLFLLVIGGIGFLTSWRIEEAFRHMQTDTLVRRAYLADMRVNLQMIARFMNALSMPELTPAERARSQQQLEERIKLFQAAEGKYSSLPPVEGDKAYMDSIHAGEAAALEAVEAMVPLAASGNSGDRRRLYGLQRDRFAPAMERATEAIIGLRKVGQIITETQTSSVHGAERRLRACEILFGVKKPVI